LAQSFEEFRAHVGVPAQATLNNSTADLQKVPAQPGSRLVGRLEIPNLDLSSVILEGVGSQTLRVGLGHVPGTSMPGQPGNVVIAGHRDTFFRPLQKIKIGDEVFVDTTARTYCYQVRSFEIVDPHNVNGLRFHDRNELTLITCYPFSYIGPASKRFVVHAEPVLVPEKCSHS
jgi:sortase A